MFKQSKYRIATYFLSLYGIRGSWPELRELYDFYYSHYMNIYPNCLQEKYPLPIGKLYGSIPVEVDKLLHNLIDNWDRCWKSYKKYIENSIIEGKNKCQVEKELTVGELPLGSMQE